MPHGDGGAIRRSRRRCCGDANEKVLHVLVALMKDDTELYKQFSDNEGFRRWLSDMVFAVTYEAAPAT